MDYSCKLFSLFDQATRWKHTNKLAYSFTPYITVIWCSIKVRSPDDIAVTNDETPFLNFLSVNLKSFDQFITSEFF